MGFTINVRNSTGIFYFILIISGFWFASCEDTDCISFSTNILSVQFLDTAGNPKGKSVDFVFSPASPEIAFYSDTTASNYLLPVNTAESETTFIFANTDSSIDTLTVGYTKRQSLISEECGFDLIFSKVTILSSSFGDARSLDNGLSLLNETNIEIYH